MIKSSLIFSLLVLFFSCSDNGQNNNPSDLNNGEWSIPQNEVRDGGPGKDGIPSVDTPQFTTTNATTYLDDNDLVIGVNDKIGTTAFAITYCPLTGTALGWDRTLNGEETTFGVSGKLYNSNLMPYDRLTDSYWSQLARESVNGELINQNASHINLIETSWKTWKTMFPEAKVITTVTGFDRNYNTYPYGDYLTSDNLIFSVSRVDPRHHPKKRVLGLLHDEGVKIYTFEDVDQKVVHDTIGGKEIIITGDVQKNYIVAFENNVNGTKREFTFDNTSDQSILQDNLGNQYNLFGEIISGTNSGSKLSQIGSYIGYWFSFPPFFTAEEISFYNE